MKLVLNVSMSLLTMSANAWAVNDACDGYGLLTGEQTIHESDVAFSGTDGSDYLGKSITVGDFNGDGFGDAAFGAPGVDHAGVDAGAAYIFFGPLGAAGSSMSAEDADVVIVGAGPRDYLGWTLSTAGDLDLDGYDDLVVGAPSGTTSGLPEGYALLILGGPAMDALITADEADAVLRGSTAGDQFGFSAINVGDMDGDGFNELAVGAPSNDYNGNDAGAVYVFPGPITGTLFADEADATIYGASNAARAGWSLASVGDFDGDTVVDIAIGSPRDRRGGYDAGAVSIVHGNVEISLDIDLGTASGVDVTNFLGDMGTRFGHAVVSPGDMSGDGTGDFVASAPRDGTNGSRAGAVHTVMGDIAYSGTQGISAASVATWFGPGAGAGLGSAITGGDFNGDMQLDIAIGADQVSADGNTRTTGAVYVMHGPFGGDTFDMAVGADMIVAGTDARGYVGASASVGFLNADGFSDLLVAGWRTTGDANKSGVVGLFLGGADTADLTKWWVDSDADGWGGSDTFVTSCDQPFGTSAFNTDCNDGNPVIHPDAAETCESGLDSNCDGHIGGGDFDGDGALSCDDCDDDDPTRSPYLAELCDSVDHNCDGDPTAGAQDSLSWYFDFDNDGFGDDNTVLAGCSKPDGVLVDLIHVGGDCNDGADAINPGAYEICNDIDENCDGEVDNDAVDAPYWFADADADGYGDYSDAMRLCTVPDGYVDNAEDCDDDDFMKRPGEIERCNLGDDDCNGLHYLGGDELASDAAHLSVLGNANGARLGDAVAILADNNGDSMDEIVVGAPNADVGGVDSGTVYISYGRPNRDIIDHDVQQADGPSYDARIVSERRRGQFGQVLSTGDYNGDGIGDLVASAPMDTLSGAQSGRVYLFFGPLSGDLLASEADLVFESAQRYSWTGGSLGTADLDGDGNDDLIIGAPRLTQGLQRRGGVFVIYGGEDMTSANLASGEADAWFFGEDAREEAGSAVAGIGDVNGDGFEDVAIGAPEALSRSGRAYLLMGSAERFNGAVLDPDVTITGTSVLDRLGTSIAALGDFTGNGFDDIAFGSSYRRSWIVQGGFAWADDNIDDLSYTVFVGAASQAAGRVVAGAGDMNGDGLADLLVSAQHDADLGVDAGAVFVIYGGQDWDEATVEEEGIWLDGVESFGKFDGAPTDTAPLRSAQNTHSYEGAKLTGPAAASFAGASIASGGDINGDGSPDMIMGAPRLSDGETEIGGAWAILGDEYGLDVDASDPTWYNWDRDMDGFAHFSEGTFVCPMHRAWDYDSAVVRAWADSNKWLDCNDNDASVHPGAVEILGDGIDQNCAPEVGNLPPTVDSCVVSPVADPAPYLADTSVALSVTGSATDPEGTPVYWSYAWIRDEGEGAIPRYVELGTDPTLAAINLERDDTIFARCTATDLADTSDSSLSAPNTVANYIPRDHTAAISAVQDGTTDIFTAPNGEGVPEVWAQITSPALDLDGDDISYGFQWLVNGIEFANTQAGEAAASGTRTGAFNGDIFTGGAWGDNITVNVLAFDGIDTTPVASQAFYTMPTNLPPTEPRVIILPEYPYEGVDDLRCRMDWMSWDPEWKPVTVTIEWLHNGLPYTGPVESLLFPGDVIPASETTATETWTCRAWANDGYQDGLDDIAQVVVHAKWGGTTVETGLSHACGRTTSGLMSCWGDNTYGQSTPPVAPGGGYVDHAAGYLHTCAVRAIDGGVDCWGDDTYGQSSPPASFASAVIQVELGERHSCVLLSDGTAECWGDNSLGQLDVDVPYNNRFYTDGVSGYPIYATPEVVEAMGLPDPYYTTIDVGRYHACGLTNLGQYFCWGDNSHGEAWDNDYPTMALDAQVGDGVTCVTSVYGVCCWGKYNSPSWEPGFHGVDVGGEGWCAIDIIADNLTCSNMAYPPPVELQNWEHISLGPDFGCGTNTNQEVTCWGDDTFHVLLTPDFTGNPDAPPELCDGYDNNGDMVVDEGCP